MVRERILLPYLRTGGGHIAAARAIERRIRELHTPDEVEVVTLDAMPPESIFWRRFFDRGYRFSSNYMRQLWVAAILVTKSKAVRRLWNAVMIRLFWRRIARTIEKHEITKIVLLHCLLIAPALYAVKRVRRHPAVMTVVLDPFTAPEFWFQRTGGPIVVFSERARRQAIERFDHPAWNVHHFPVILRSQFGRPLSEERVLALRRELGFSADKRVVLLAGGGEGLPNGERYAQSLVESDLDVEIAVVCGKDALTRSRVERIRERNPGKAVHVYGFVDFMFELMNVADIIVSKGGPATVMESLMLKKPLIVSQYLYGQERGNVDFVLTNKIGFYIEEPAEIVSRIRQLVQDPAAYDVFRARIERLTLRNGTDEIVDFILALKARPSAAYRPRLREMLFSPDGRPYPLKQAFGYMVAYRGSNAVLKRRKA